MQACSSDPSTNRGATSKPLTMNETLDAINATLSGQSIEEKNEDVQFSGHSGREDKTKDCTSTPFSCPAFITFYVYEDSKGAHRVIECRIADKTTNILVARGVAVCSRLDAPNDKKGKRIAHGRAMKALFSGISRGLICRPEAIDILRECGAAYITFRGEYAPVLPKL